MKEDKKLIVAYPHGFCAGVTRAVKTAQAAAEKIEGPVYCLHDIVHNDHVVGGLREKGIQFVQSLTDVPDGAAVLFSAHGVSPAVRSDAEKRELNIIDATCPYVTKVHNEVRRYAGQGYTVFLAGYRNHQEVIGVAGEAPDNVIVIESGEEAMAASVPDPDKTAVVTQTTLSLAQADAVLSVLRARFKGIVEPGKSDICYATENRQLAAQMLAKQAELTIVLGSSKSSNSQRLVEVAESAGCPAILVSDVSALDGVDLDGVRVLGLTSGASTPEDLCENVILRLRSRGFDTVEQLEAVKESGREFKLPI